MNAKLKVIDRLTNKIEIRVVCNNGNYEATHYSVRTGSEALTRKRMVEMLRAHYKNRGHALTDKQIADRHGVSIEEDQDPFA